MGTLLEGAKQAVINCLKLEKDEHLLLITSRERIEIGETLKKVAKEITNNIYFFVMEDLAERPYKEVPKEIWETADKVTASIYAAPGLPGELPNFRIPLLAKLDSRGVRHGHMIGVSNEIMEQGMCADYAKIQRINRWLLDIITGDKKIKITNKAGTDLIVETTSKHKWINGDGALQPGAWQNLPEGEIFTTPANVNGKFVVDACLGDYLSEKFGDIQNTPLSVEIKNSRADLDSVTCSRKEIIDAYKSYISNSDENGNRCGEFAIGTNLGLTKIIGNLLQDEKFPGAVHFAFGDAYGDKTGADWKSKTHLDAITRDVTLYIDDKLVIKDGKFIGFE